MIKQISIRTLMRIVLVLSFVGFVGIAHADLENGLTASNLNGDLVKSDIIPTFPPVPSTAEVHRVNGHNAGESEYEADMYIWSQDNKLYVHIIPITTAYKIYHSSSYYGFSITQDNIQTHRLCFKDPNGRETQLYNHPIIYVPMTFELKVCSSATDEYIFDASESIVVCLDAMNGDIFVWRLNPYTQDELEEEYRSGVEYCQNNPSLCGLFSQTDIDAKYAAGSQACKDDPVSCGIGQNLIFANTANPVLQSGASVNVYGNAEINKITLKSGASAKLINFVGSNEVTVQADSTLFNVSRSGATVTFKDSDNTVLTIPATKTSQTIIFNDVTLTLVIDNNQVKLGNQVINLTPSSIL